MKNMRKHILFLCTLCLGLVSCVKDDMNVVQGDGMTVFRAVYSEMPQSKTVLSGMTPFWQPTDKISIYDGKNNEFVNTGAAASASTSFKGVLAGKGRTHYLAAYPYNDSLSFSFMGMTIYSLYMPEKQTAVENSYDPSAAVAVAYTKTSELAFKNVSSLIKFKVISDDVKSVTIIPNGDDEILAGSLNVTIDDPLRLTIMDGKSSVVLNGEFKKGSTYYIATLPATLKNGMTVLLNESVKSFVADYPIELARSGMVDLGTLSLVPSESQKPEDPGDEEDDAVLSEWVLKGSFNEWTDEGTLPLYEVGSNYVAFDVPASIADGFKFNSGDNWLGNGATVSVGSWMSGLYSGGEELNITFAASSEDALYDIYLAKSLTAFCIVNAGETVPVRDESDSGTGDIETSGVIYMKPNSNWLDAGAWFSAYFFGGPYGDLWMNMTDEDADGVYECEVPVGYGNVIFVRMNPASAENSWDNKWGQTADLLVPADDNICYVIAKGSWDSGSWTTFPPTEDGSGDDSGDDGSDDDPIAGENEQVVYLNAGGSFLWDQAGAWFEVWSWATGSDGAWYTMTSAGSGIYACTIPKANTNIIFVRRGPDMTQGWDLDVHYWNKTDDLSIPSGMNCYTITGWGGTEGSWSVK